MSRMDKVATLVVNEIAEFPKEQHFVALKTMLVLRAFMPVEATHIAVMMDEVNDTGCSITETKVYRAFFKE